MCRTSWGPTPEGEPPRVLRCSVWLPVLRPPLIGVRGGRTQVGCDARRGPAGPWDGEAQRPEEASKKQILHAPPRPGPARRGRGWKEGVQRLGSGGPSTPAPAPTAELWGPKGRWASRTRRPSPPLPCGGARPPPLAEGGGAGAVRRPQFHTGSMRRPPPPRRYKPLKPRRPRGGRRRPFGPGPVAVGAGGGPDSVPPAPRLHCLPPAGGPRGPE